jgi:isopenicillin-N N-acyltransferase-like protein
MNTPLPVIEVSGTPAEMGHRYGVEAGDLIVANVDAYMARFDRAVGLDLVAVAQHGAAFGATTRQHFPRLAQMLEAMAAAAGVSPDLIYAINARSELLYGNTDLQECTAIGLLNEKTVIAQNWDWHPDQRPYTLLLITRDERGHQVAALTEAGMLAKAGINNSHLGVCVNLIGCDRDGRPGGVPYHVLLRSVLEADSLSWATRNAIRAPRSASINLLIGQSHPEGGELLDLELAPGEAGWLHPRDGILVHANHFESNVPVYDTIKDWGGSSLFRSARARRMLEEKKSVLDVLTDHHSYPLSICRHLDERDAEGDRSETIWTVLMDLDERSIQLIPGPPCTRQKGLELKPFD